MRSRSRLTRLQRPRPPRAYCPQGHAYTPDNSYVRRDGSRDCRVCKRLSDARRRRVLQPELTEFLRKIKLASGCVDCGYREDASRLAFDHRPGTLKLFVIGKDMRTRETLLREIEKCDVRCHHCHATRHYLAGKLRSANGRFACA